MVFNTGAALLDAIVLAVVSRMRKVLMVIRLRRMCGKPLKCQNQRCIRCCEDCRRTVVWKYTTENVGAEIEGIIR